MIYQTKWATISPCGLYRYDLGRTWAISKMGSALFIMLNPSKADGERDDATIRRCVSFARSWGYGGLVVLNLFGLRATDPRELYKHAEPVGPGNDDMIRTHMRATDKGYAAWGAHGKFRFRNEVVRGIFREAGVPLFCLKKTVEGHPHHPLRLRGDTRPFPY